VLVAIRGRGTVPGMVLFVVAGLVVCHFAVPTEDSEAVGAGLLWVVILFTAMLALGKAMDVPPEEVATLFAHFNPGVSVPARFKRMLDQDYANPSWELAMARKDARLMEAEAARAGVPMIMLPGAVAKMDAVIAEGHGHADWTVVAKDVLPPKRG